MNVILNLFFSSWFNFFFFARLNYELLKNTHHDKEIYREQKNSWVNHLSATEFYELSLVQARAFISSSFILICYKQSGYIVQLTVQPVLKRKEKF